MREVLEMWRPVSVTCDRYNIFLVVVCVPLGDVLFTVSHFQGPQIVRFHIPSTYGAISHS